MKKIISLLLLTSTLVGIAYYFNFPNQIELSSNADRTLAGPQKNICSITINSDNELRTFKQKLSSDGRFKFTEMINGNDNWFDQACDSQVQCDVLIISGHFGGTFFGKSGSHLSLSELESKSCSKKCRGILEAPKEIYLFGCNTLASKNASTRTPEQYLHVLLEDGLERSFAERVVEARYGPSGEENVNRMKRAFPGVPVIYGFCDKAPLGEEAAPILQKYLSGKSKDDYYDRLNKLEVTKNTMQPYTTATIEQLIDAPLANSFKSIGRCFSQITGVDTKDDTANRICAIRDTRNSIEARSRDLNILMRTKESLSYIELCNDFFNEVNKKSLTPSELSAVGQIKNNEELRNDLESLLNKVTFFLGFDYGILAVQLGLDKNKVIPVLTRGFERMVTKGLTREEINMMIDLDFKNPFKEYIRISFSAIDSAATWSNANSIEAIGLTKTNDPAIINRLQQLMSTAPLDLRRQLLEALMNLNAVNISMKEALIGLLYDNNPDVRANSIRALAMINSYDEKVINEIIALMNRETDAWTLKKSALYFTDVPFDNPMIQAHLAKHLSHPNAEVRQYSALALSQRRVKDYAVFEALTQGLKDSVQDTKLSCRFTLKKYRASIPLDLAQRIQSESPADYDFIFDQ